MVASGSHVRFVVEQAGCQSCAIRIRDALAPMATVQGIVIDEQADVATVSLAMVAMVSENDVTDALQAASVGAGHEYRVRHGSWEVS